MELSSRPIFVVGSPRSGTSIISQAIDAHPRIFCPYWETGLFVRYQDMLDGQLVWSMKQKNAMPLARRDFIDWIRRSLEDLMLRFAAASGKERWCEKTPAHVFHMGLIAEVFPDAQFVHMVRNGREVVRSLMQMEWAPRSSMWSVRRWVDSVRAGRKIGAALPASQYIEIRYEDLLASPRETLQHLCAFLGEQWSPNMLNFHLPECNSWGYSCDQLQPQSVGRHPSLRPFTRAVFSLYGSHTMRELGYQ